MPSIVVAVATGLLVICAIGVPKTATAQQQACSDLLPGNPVPTVARALRGEDLVALRDIGPQFLVSPGDLFAVSPDGHSLAFEIHKADPVSNRYCVGLAVFPIGDASAGIARLVDTGGDLLPATVRDYGWAALPTGLVDPATPRWMSDGHGIAFLKRLGGSTQVWRADKNGKAAVQVTHSATDVEDFRIGQDGQTILYATRPGLIDANEAIEHEGLSGWHFDTRAYPLHGARPLTPDVAPLRYFAVNGATGVERAATESETAAFADGTSSVEGAGVADRAVLHGRVVPAISHERVVARDRSGKMIICPAAACRVDSATRFWWSDARHVLIFAGREGWGDSETALYRWTPGTASPRRLLRTADDLVECHIAARNLVCLVEGSASPRHFVEIDLGDGREQSVFDPNPEFHQLALGSVERLHWIARSGFEAYADLVYPVGFRPGRRYPLVVVQYRTRGFLRGGVGDEFPIQAFANRGYFVLSTEDPTYDQLVGKYSNSLDQDRAFNQDFTGRREILASIEQALQSLIARGLVDPARIGITGLSDGSSTVQFAELNSAMFAAGSATGCCWEPTQDAVLGPVIAGSLHERGWPTLDDAGSRVWSTISLSQRASHAAFPLLLQAADGEYRAALESYTALAQAHVPVDLFVFDNEDHVKIQPAHRLAVYRRNLAWFDFWLKNQTSADSTEQSDAARWAKMKASSKVR